MYEAALDTYDELVAAPFIAAHGWYRQATATLRNALEMMVHASRYSVKNDLAALEKWRANTDDPKFGNSVDIIFIERLWRTLKYEYISISPPASGADLKESLSQYIVFYNSERPHNGIGESTPDEAYYQLQLPTPQIA